MTEPLPVLEFRKNGFVYNRSPVLLYWEATRACELVCRHCRAESVPFRHPNELKTDEVKEFFHSITLFADGGGSAPHIVITGGDPLLRPDLKELVAYGTGLGLDISITPAGTSRLTREILVELKKLGIKSLGLSLDGSNPERHDALRGVRGSFEWTSRGAKYARDLGLPLQVNTMVTKETLDDIWNVFEILKEWEIARWALFFLIPTGRGQALSEISPKESERFLNRLWKISGSSPFPIKTTEAHHFRRIGYLKLRNRGLKDDEILKTPLGRGFGIRDANGIVFVSHTGIVSPSGFLPFNAGSIREQPLTEIYRNSPVFRTLRDMDQLKGKCGRCEFRQICGGSRARAYAITGDYMESDTLCLYKPEADRVT